MAPVTHTPLESFLLLWALSPFDRVPFVPSFDRASDTLKKSRLLKASGLENGQRLDPRSLEDLYLSLVKEQAKLDAPSRNGSPQKGSIPRKRKLASPPLQSLEEASKYNYLLPHLADRLYHEYQSEAISDIRAEETRYKFLQQDSATSKSQTATTLRSQPVPAQTSSQGIQTTLENFTKVRPSAQVAKETAGANGSSTTQAQSKPESPGHVSQPLQQTPSQSSQAGNAPVKAQAKVSAPAVIAFPPGNDTKQSFQAQSSPRPGQPGFNPNNRRTGSPVVLPTQNTQSHPPGPSAHPSEARPDAFANQYRPPYPSTASLHQGAPYPPPGGQIPTAQRSNTQPQYYYDSHGYPVSYPPYGQGTVPMYHPHGGTMQPYTPSPGQSNRQSPYAAPPYRSPGPSGYYPYPYQAQAPYGQAAPQYADPKSPAPAVTPRAETVKPSPIVTSATSTKWKDVDPAAHNRTSKSPARPSSRDISPISEPESPTEESKTISKLKHRGKTASSTRSQTELDDESSAADSRRTSRLRRKGGGRDIGGRKGRPRAESAASSARPGSSRRSRSVTEDLTDFVKAEPLTRDDSVSVTSPTTAEGAPRRMMRRHRDGDQKSESELSRSFAKRKRDDGRELSISITKAGRGEASTPRRSIPKRPGYVLATRNFQRIAIPLINQITAHRLGSLFAKPLTEREAPGYKDLIYCPQDLKSIKAAINAGGRTATAAIDEDPDSASAGAHVWLPESEELRPPRGIVNADQLEKELMRIFANAIMFNPEVSKNRGIGSSFKKRQLMRPTSAGSTLEEDEDANASPVEGAVVTDAREVARDVQETFAAWRLAEREVDEEDARPGSSTPMKLRDGGDGAADDDSKLDSETRETADELEEEGERRSKRRRRG